MQNQGAIQGEEQVEVGEHQTWLDKMGTYLRWKVIGPDIKNPFAPAISDMALRRVLAEPQLMYEQLDLRCTCDGHEVLYMRNIARPFIRSDHPCIRLLNQVDLLDAISRQDINDLIAEEADRIYQEFKEEFEKRKTTKTKSQALERGGKTVKEIKMESNERRKLEAALDLPDKFKGKDQHFRIMKK